MEDATESLASAKRALRAEMRRRRRDLPDRPERSALIVAHLIDLDAVLRAQRVLVYDAVVGEVELGAFGGWCRSTGKLVAVPEDDPDPAWADVIVVPGTAFTADGHRLGQGGGWYDRWLPRRRAGVPMIGVGFAVQLVAELPTEPHDVELDCIVTEDGAVWADA